ncbi:MAG: class II fructose-bisphosphatase [Deltaproteobacteria bacterium]|nr:class II fructose-bisphosphatase [Deltaproteobacteria bacterium]
MDRNLALEMVRVTEAAAINSARLMGKGDGKAADQAAVDAMRKSLSHMDFDGTVVIGEGERDEAPMLYIGEKVGLGGSLKVDIALDPLEGTNLCATGAPNALAVIAIAEKGNFLHAPDTYMNKIATGPAGQGVIDLQKSPTENLQALAEAKACRVEDLTVVILDRSRHEDLIAEVRQSGARIKLISDGDVSAAIATCDPNSDVDILFGIGGAPEGVLAAAALKCLGGVMQAQLRFRHQEEKDRARKMGLEDLEKIFTLNDLAKGEVMFAATGVTSGDLLRGVRFFPGGAHTYSIVMRSLSKTVRHVEATHHFDSKPKYD